MSTPLSWKETGRIDRSRLIEARLLAHHALQPLAGAARLRLPAQPDDSHTSLSWRSDAGALETGVFAGGSTIRFSVRDLTFSHGAQSFEASGRTQGEIGAWLSEALGAEPDTASDLLPPPYDMPPHPVAEGAAIDPGPWCAELEALSNWFDNANACLEQATAGLAGVHAVSPVRCWPHHFDIAALVALEAQTGEDSKSVNAGLSPGDDSYDQPYFYVSPWPYPEASALKELPAGSWRTEGFTAAILAAKELSEAASPAETVLAFLEAAIEASRSALA